MAHPDTLLPMPTIDDPVERFVAVVKFYLSGWHIKPPYVLSSFRLRSVLTCYQRRQEAVESHIGRNIHLLLGLSRQHQRLLHLRADVTPSSQVLIFLHGSRTPYSSRWHPETPKQVLGQLGCQYDGGHFLSQIHKQRKVERWREIVRPTAINVCIQLTSHSILTQPNMYARGILFGKMKYELGDHSVVRCPENHLAADIEFKTKGWVSGTYNAIGGVIKNDRTGEVLYELSGLWSGEMFIKDVKTGQKKMLFDATHAKHAPPKTRPIEEQGERESQRLWLPTVKAVHVMDHDTATTEKAKIEDRQREEAKKREEMGIDWHPKLFRRVQAGPGGPEEGEEDLEWIINAHL